MALSSFFLTPTFVHLKRKVKLGVKYMYMKFCFLFSHTPIFLNKDRSYGTPAMCLNYSLLTLNLTLFHKQGQEEWATCLSSQGPAPVQSWNDYCMDNRCHGNDSGHITETERNCIRPLKKLHNGSYQGSAVHSHTQVKPSPRICTSSYSPELLWQDV